GESRDPSGGSAWAPAFAGGSGGKSEGLQEVFVSGAVHQRLVFGGVGDLDLGEPAGLLGLVVDRLRSVAERGVALDHFAGQGRVDVGGRLDALDDGEVIAGLHGLADFRNLDEHHVAELLGGVGGDADGGDVALKGDPLVILGETH